MAGSVQRRLHKAAPQVQVDSSKDVMCSGRCGTGTWSSSNDCSELSGDS